MVDSEKFDPYTYQGSPNVEVSLGFAVTFFSLLLFSFLNFAVTKLGPYKNVRGDVWRCRNTFISWIHSDLVAIGVIYSLVFKPEQFDDLIISCDYFMYSVVALSLGYFMYDVIDHVYNGRHFSNWEVLLHHVGVIWCFWYSIYYRMNMPYMIMALLTEINSVFLHARKLMQFDQWPFDHWLYRTVVFLNFVTFITCRMYAIIFIGYGVYTEWNRMTLIFGLFSIITMGVMYCINPILLWRLFKSDVLRKYSRSYSKDRNQKHGPQTPVHNGTNGVLH